MSVHLSLLCSSLPQLQLVGLQPTDPAVALCLLLTVPVFFLGLFMPLPLSTGVPLLCLDGSFLPFPHASGVSVGSWRHSELALAPF